MFVVHVLSCVCVVSFVMYLMVSIVRTTLLDARCSMFVGCCVLVVVCRVVLDVRCPFSVGVWCSFVLVCVCCLCCACC